jgi:hypothetical protein
MLLQGLYGFGKSSTDAAAKAMLSVMASLSPELLIDYVLFI